MRSRKRTELTLGPEYPSRARQQAEQLKLSASIFINHASE